MFQINSTDPPATRYVVRWVVQRGIRGRRTVAGGSGALDVVAGIAIVVPVAVVVAEVEMSSEQEMTQQSATSRKLKKRILL